MARYVIVGIIGGIFLAVIVGLYFLGSSESNPDVKQDTPDNEQSRNVLTLYPAQVLPFTTITLFQHPTMPYMPMMPKMPMAQRNPDSQTAKQYDEALQKYQEDMKKYEIKQAKFDEDMKKYYEAMENYTISYRETIRYGEMTLTTDKLELQIHDLINQERAKHHLDPLMYDYQISNIARDHSLDMNINNYFAHEDSDGRGPSDRGAAYGYTECGDRATIQLKEEYDQLLKRFEDTGNTDVQMYNQLQQMQDQINSAIDKKMIFGGLSENIFQNSLYDQYWTTDGAIRSYDWSTSEEIAKTTVDGWMNSTGHRQNILTPYYASEGIGVSMDKDYKLYITQNFC